MERHSKFQRPDPSEPRHLSCEVCKREIPTSVAESLEGPDYLIHFCGIECLGEWQKAHGETIPPR